MPDFRFKLFYNLFPHVYPDELFRILCLDSGETDVLITFQGFMEMDTIFLCDV